MDKHIILGVHITDRFKQVATIQGLFTEYGCNIKTRLGLHEVGREYCSPRGLILLEMFGDEQKCLEMADKLKAIEGIEVQKMIFGHA